MWYDAICCDFDVVILHCVVWFGNAAWHGMVWCDVAWCDSVILHGMAWCDLIWSGSFLKPSTKRKFCWAASNGSFLSCMCQILVRNPPLKALSKISIVLNMFCLIEKMFCCVYTMRKSPINSNAAIEHVIQPFCTSCIWPLLSTTSAFSLSHHLIVYIKLLPVRNAPFEVISLVEFSCVL